MKWVLRRHLETSCPAGFIREGNKNVPVFKCELTLCAFMIAVVIFTGWSVGSSTLEDMATNC